MADCTIKTVVFEYEGLIAQAEITLHGTYHYFATRDASGWNWRGAKPRGGVAPTFSAAWEACRELCEKGEERMIPWSEAKSLNLQTYTVLE